MGAKKIKTKILQDQLFDVIEKNQFGTEIALRALRVVTELVESVHADSRPKDDRDWAIAKLLIDDCIKRTLRKYRKVLTQHGMSVDAIKIISNLDGKTRISTGASDYIDYIFQQEMRVNYLGENTVTKQQ